MMNPSQQLTTFQTGCTRVTDPVRADVANPSRIRRREVGGDCFITLTTTGQLQTMANSSVIPPNRTPPLRHGRNQKPKRVHAAFGPLEHKI